MHAAVDVAAGSVKSVVKRFLGPLQQPVGYSASWPKVYQNKRRNGTSHASMYLKEVKVSILYVQWHGAI